MLQLIDRKLGAIPVGYWEANGTKPNASILKPWSPRILLAVYPVVKATVCDTESASTVSPLRQTTAAALVTMQTSLAALASVGSAPGEGSHVNEVQVPLNHRAVHCWPCIPW